MAVLSTSERTILEKLFQMGSGNVLDLSIQRLRDMFRNDLSVDIYDEKFNYASGSKANRLRCFWSVEDSSSVAKSIRVLTAYVETQVLVGTFAKGDFDSELISHARGVEQRLEAKGSSGASGEEANFLRQQYPKIDISSLPLDPSLTKILNERVVEITRCRRSKAFLAAVILSGSCLEGVLLGVAANRAKTFNQSKASPKDKTGQVKRFADWTLSDLIEVACDLRLVGEDVKKFSHSLREFRNYIHPSEQLRWGFRPDEHTIAICWQVLRAAVSQVARAGRKD